MNCCEIAWFWASVILEFTKLIPLSMSVVDLISGKLISRLARWLMNLTQSMATEGGGEKDLIKLTLGQVGRWPEESLFSKVVVIG